MFTDSCRLRVLFSATPRWLNRAPRVGVAALLLAILVPLAAPVGAFAAPVNTVLPKITGTAKDGQTLTSTTGTWTGASITYARQWQRCDTAGANCAAISGAAGTTYLVQSADVGKTIRVNVVATNSTGSASALSAKTGTVTALAPANTAVPAISGVAKEGRTLTGTVGNWSGTTPLTYARQWLRCSSTGASCTNIASATASTYTVVAADLTKTVRFKVTASNAAGSASAQSVQTAVVTTSAPVNTGLPAVSGQANEAKTLTSTAGSWAGSPTISTSTSWLRCDTAGATCQTIPTVTGNTYKLTSADIGHTVRSRVTATNAVGSATSDSLATGTVGARLTPAFVGSVDTVGDLSIIPTADDDPQTLSVSTTNPWVYLIQRMPSTKTITDVSLGDFQTDSCTQQSPTVGLRIYDLDNGFDAPVQYAESRGDVPLPSAPTQLHWLVQDRSAVPVPRVILKAGHAYGFSLVINGCTSIRQTTWAPRVQAIEAPRQSCTMSLPFGPYSTSGSLRMQWRDASTSYGSSCINTRTYEWPSYPDGWLASVTYNGSARYIRTAAHTTPLGPPNNGECADPALAEHGIHEQYWKESTDFAGAKEYVCSWDHVHSPGVTTSFGWSTALPIRGEFGGGYRLPSVKLETINYDSLLQTYNPVLVVDSRESYYPESATAMVNWAGTNCTGPNGGTTLNHRDPNGFSERLANANGSCGLPQLTDSLLVPLGTPYTDVSPAVFPAYPASNSDYLDEDDTDRAGVSASVYASMGPTVYARVYQDQFGTTFLQYWYWYYFNDGKAPGEYFDHEGDWEMVQLRLDANDAPIMATFAQHDVAERCPWAKMRKRYGTRPVVYPANGRHAAYFVNGQHPRPQTPLHHDDNNALGGEILPVATVVHSYTPFVRWPGKWGDSGSPEGPSPEGPASHSQWMDATDFEADSKLDDCADGKPSPAETASRKGLRARPRVHWLPAPRITATRVKDRVRVRYRVSATGKPTHLTLALHPSLVQKGRPQPPRVKEIYVGRKRSGTATVRLPLGRGPYTLFASTESARAQGLTRRVRPR